MISDTIEAANKYIIGIANTFPHNVIDLSLNDHTVQHWEYNKGDNQKWLMRKKADTNFWSIQMHDPKTKYIVGNLAVRTTVSGDPLILSEPYNDFLWEIRENHHLFTIPGFFQIVASSNSNLALGISGETTAIQLQPFSEESRQQIWVFSKV